MSIELLEQVWREGWCVGNWIFHKDASQLPDLYRQTLLLSDSCCRTAGCGRMGVRVKCFDCAFGDEAYFRVQELRFSVPLAVETFLARPFHTLIREVGLLDRIEATLFTHYVDQRIGLEIVKAFIGKEPCNIVCACLAIQTSKAIKRL